MVLPYISRTQNRRAQPHAAQRYLFSALCLALWRSAAGGREFGSKSFAVDTGAHFHKSGFGHKRRRQEAEESPWREERSRRLTQKLSHDDSEAGESDMVERLGHEIAKDLAHELRRHQDGDRMGLSGDTLELSGDTLGAAEIERATNVATHRQHARRHPRALHRSRAGSVRPTHSSASQPAAPASLLERLESVSQDLDTASALEQSATQEANIASETSLDIAQHRRGEKSRPSSQSVSAVSGATAKSTQVNSLRDFANLFQPEPLAMSALQLHQGQGLDGVAGNLLQLEKAVAHEEKLRSTRMGEEVPDFESLDKEHKGSLTLEQFMAHRGLGRDSLVQAAFKKVDTNESGKIDREEYDQAVKDGIITPELFGSGCFRPHISLLCIVLMLVCKLS